MECDRAAGQGRFLSRCSLLATAGRVALGSTFKVPVIFDSSLKVLEKESQLQLEVSELELKLRDFTSELDSFIDL